MNNFLLYASAVIIWGSTWILINYQIGTVAPEVSVVYRYAIATVLLMGFAWLRGLQIRFGLKQHIQFFLAQFFSIIQ